MTRVIQRIYYRIRASKAMQKTEDARERYFLICSRNRRMEYPLSGDENLKMEALIDLIEARREYELYLGKARQLKAGSIRKEKGRLVPGIATS